ncbi:hypothetical protein L1987_44307 [Smallanthus sonchifolius]|uniref:Uncharacterized protein n=1 Tax=Smallanthus sonchifolius TaxID=185202 RepID=A0ACB9GQ53_9ASTR|nr:hypothetical protein L1987_44307 [Smallanthus sonchifolius]
MFHATKDEHVQSFLTLKQKPSLSISTCRFVFGYSSTATTRRAIGFICYFECLRYKIHPFDLYPERLRLQHGKVINKFGRNSKNKAKEIKANARDVDYIPTMGDDSEGDYQEVATTVQVSKKQHRPRYIAPMSMNRLANLAKQHRVIAPKVSHKFQLDSNATKDNHIVVDLILRKKCPQRQMEASKQNVAHRPNIQLVLVDEDDEIFQADVDENDEYEIHGDDSDKDLENEDDVLVEEQLEGHELEKAIVSKSKKRGPTMMHVVHTRKLNEREVIICNDFGQPIRPVTEEKDIVGKFSQFLGTIARNHSYASLIHNSWHKEKYDVPDTARTWVLRTIGSSYRPYSWPLELPSLFHL